MTSDKGRGFWNILETSSLLDDVTWFCVIRFIPDLLRFLRFDNDQRRHGSSPEESSWSRRRHRHGSRYSSSSSSSSAHSRSRSRPRCCRASDHSVARRRSPSISLLAAPIPGAPSRYGRRRYSRSSSRSSSRERYYRRSRRSRSRSSSYRRTRGAYIGKFRCRFSPSPVKSYYRRGAKSPERSVRLSQKDKMDLLNIARENAAKILGVEVVTLPASVRFVKEQVEKTRRGSDTEKRVRADPVPPQGEGRADVEISRTSPARKSINFSVSNAVAKPSSSPTLHVTESKLVSAGGSPSDSGRFKPYKTCIFEDFLRFLRFDNDQRRHGSSQEESSWSRRRHRHGSRYSSSSSSSSSHSRSRSRPRCCRASDHSRCRRHRHRSRSCSPYPRRSSLYGRRRYSRSSSRSSSRERYYRRSRRSRSRSSSYRRTRGAYIGKFRCRFSPSPVKSYYRRGAKSPERSVRLSQKDKMDLLNIARENAAKILGVEVVTLPASVRFVKEQVEKTRRGSDTEKRVRADPVPPQGEGRADVEISRTSPARKTINFSVSNAVAKPSSSPTLHVTESKVTSRADRVGNRMPYGQWIPVKSVSSKKR
ncbi:hypothetical protein AMELA_G00043950 [Ameiurus melas]|uniref:Arginine/serine-rich protein 1 n=1 Tax=Ameiurus melas TaxID=219545 RepID=A0A7J6B859_AMEME|nr:hypothetical protein AMELA_G00043950 [Ameiurus melas]